MGERGICGGRNREIVVGDNVSYGYNEEQAGTVNG